MYEEAWRSAGSSPIALYAPATSSEQKSDERSSELRTPRKARTIESGFFSYDRPTICTTYRRRATRSSSPSGLPRTRSRRTAILWKRCAFFAHVSTSRQKRSG